MAHPVEITDQTFDEEVLKASKPVLVDFWAAWCGPCRLIAPIVEEIAKEQADRLKVAKVDVDANLATASRFGILNIPTLLLFKDGQPVETIVGYLPKQQLMKRIEPHLQAASTGR
ncbi:MAG TPA: thioredoxin [Chloroflexota bacterium]|jgi:thioredoxin 1